MHVPDINIEKWLSFPIRLAQVKSYSETDGELEITSFIAQKMKDIGTKADVYPFADRQRQNAIGRWKGSGPSTAKASFSMAISIRTLSLKARRLTFGKAKIDKDLVFGIRVSNMKSDCAAYFCNIKTLKNAGWTPKGDVIMAFVVGELQGGVGTLAAVDQGQMKADYFINCEPSDIKAATMHAGALMFEIDLIEETRHISACKEATGAIEAGCALFPNLNWLTFSVAKSEDYLKCNRC